MSKNHFSRLALSLLLCFGIFHCSPEKELEPKHIATAQELASDEDFKKVMELTDQLLDIAAKRVYDFGSLENASKNLQEEEEYLKSHTKDKEIGEFYDKKGIDTDALKRIDVELRQCKKNLSEKYVNIEKLDTKIILEAAEIRGKLDLVGRNMRGFDTPYTGMCTDCIANNCSYCQGDGGGGGGGNGEPGNSFDPGNNNGNWAMLQACLNQRAVLKSAAYAWLRNETAGSLMGCVASGVGTGLATAQLTGILALIPGLQEIPAVAGLLAGGTVSTVCISWVLNGLASQVIIIEMEYQHGVNDCYSRWR